MNTQNLIFDTDLIRRYDTAGPRYTSYPTAVQFHNHFTTTDYQQHAQHTDPQRPLSLYFHIPFCSKVCYYCACNKVVTKHRSEAEPYLQRLHHEITLQSQLFGKQRTVKQLHWGGGTPTFISPNEMRTLMQTTRDHFHLLDDDSGEYSIEVDPREAQGNTIPLLREIGFNRLSLGIQDFEPTVQQAVNRIQSEAETCYVINQARQAGFKSISIDLIYGLPHQNVTTFTQTLEKIITLSPDRISVFNYAHLPDLFKPQRRINVTELPTPAEKLAILQTTIERLTAANYVYIGMDHFAKPDDELTLAQRNGSLYRNFQGYATYAECDLIAMGITAISKIGNSYSQHVKTVEEYYTHLDANTLPVMRGITLQPDDILRREIINQLMCHFQLNFQTIENQFNLDFKDYFKTELEKLETLANDGLINIDTQQIHVLPRGRLLVRHVCMIFDRYLQQTTEQRRFSKVI